MIRITIGIVLSCSLCANAWGGLPERFIDHVDGAFDLSKHLLEHSGMLPVPIIITEPALGYGLGAAAVYFDEAIASKNRERSVTDRFAPPNISVIGGFKTENQSWGVGGGLFRSWDNDRYRYLGGLGKAELNLDFYGPLGRPYSYNLSGKGLVQQLTMRLGDGDWLIGGRYVYFGTESDFTLHLPAEIRKIELDMDIGKLGLLVNYDSRDNILTPNRGTFIEAEAAAAREWLGSTREFETLNARAFHYIPFQGDFILGLRGDFQLATDDAPFFALPYISLRGVPALRYQDLRTAVAEAELRWNLTPRWALVGFTGAGRAYGRRNDFGDAETVVNKGLGFRYLLASKLGLYAGIDVARGPEDEAFYIQIGNAWR